MTPRNLIRELAESALMGRMLESRRRKIGETITSLPNEKREVLKDLKSKDVEDVRWPKF